MASRPLIVRTCNWVGESVLCVPALQLLQAHGFAPQLVGRRWTAPLLAGFGWPVTVRGGDWRARVGDYRGLRQAARQQDAGFDRRDNTLLFTNSLSSALEARLAGLRPLGYRRDGRSLLLSRGLAMPDEQHALLRYWHLACALLGQRAEPPAQIDWRVAPAAQQQADALLAKHGLAAQRFVAICPFAATAFAGQDKSWPGFAALSARLHAAGWPVVACPGPDEAAGLDAQFPGVIALPGVDLGVYAAVLQRAALVVSNDTGPGHLAAAVGVPLLSVLGPTLPGLWAPWGPKVTVLRRWPQWHTVDEVLEAALARLPAGPATAQG